MISCLFECEIDRYCNNDNRTPLRKNVNVVVTCLDSLFNLLIKRHKFCYIFINRYELCSEKWRWYPIQNNKRKLHYLSCSWAQINSPWIFFILWYFCNMLSKCFWYCCHLWCMPICDDSWSGCCIQVWYTSVFPLLS